MMRVAHTHHMQNYEFSLLCAFLTILPWLKTQQELFLVDENTVLLASLPIILLALGTSNHNEV